MSVSLKPQTVKYITESSALFQPATAGTPLLTVYYRLFSISQNKVF
jgi:hypothetical protein